MNGSGCELATERAVKDKAWRQHAAGCTDCGEMLKVGDWMNRFAESTAVSSALPSAGLLLFKARLMKRLASADRAARPIRVMSFVALFLAIVSTGAVIFGTESQLGAIAIEAAGLLATYAAAIIAAAVVAAIVCLMFAYLLKRSGP